MAMMIICVYGQRPSVTLTFTADENGQHVPLNSILIENLTREVDTILYAPDTLLVVDYLVGVLEINNAEGKAFNVAQNYPNPIDCKTTIDLSLPKTDNVLIVISDMLGRELQNQNFRLEHGNHSFTFYPGLESLYFLTVRTDHHSQTIKMINTPAQSLSPTNCTLEYKGMKSGIDQYKSGNDETSFVYYLGDQLKFTAFANIGERVISSSPTGDKTYHFNFTGTSCPGNPTVTDIDGNFYNTVMIGDQCWMKENLKTTTFRNGTPIPNVTNGDEWANLITGAYSWYGNQVKWKESYGALYNWFAIVDPNELCPEGWHVPSWDSWTQLINFAVSQGYPNQWNDPNGAGNALKSCRQLDSPLGGGCNTTEHPRWSAHGTHHGFDAFGFSALPGGYRVANGLFVYLWGYGGWWSSTETIPISAWNHHLYHYEANVIMYSYFKEYGFSVRCMRDDIPPTIYNLNLEVIPADAGTVSGTGQYEAGEDVNVSAISNPGWDFVNWTDDDGIVSDLASFTFTMPAQDITLTANFIEEQGGFNCGDTLIDPRDGQSYATVQIGNQCWMAENLKVGTMIIGTQEMTDNGIIEKYCYDNDTTNCDIYGGLYQWDEMMNYSISPGVQGLCPDGWHIPTDDEWTILTGFVSKQPEYLCNNDSINIAKALAANTNWIYYSDTCSVGFNLAGNNATGFSCLPGSLRLANGNFGYSLDGDGYWWSSTRYSNSYPWSHWTVYFEKSIIRSTFIKFNGASVRCIMDSIPLGNHILNLEADPANAGILNGAGQYQAGEDVNISATANPGWEFVNWKEDDVIVSTEASFNYTMPAQNINLTANFIQAPGSFECGVGTIADVDGNIYYTVLIDSQCWLKENLRTTKYRNGTPIEYLGFDNSAWLNNTSGAYAWWSNDVSWKTKYGALYNWHAVNNSNGLCPDGWHVPTDAEWTILVDYVIAQGYPNNNYNNPNGAGNALKSCRQLNSPLGGDCNTSEHPRWISNSVHHGFDIFGFTALPGGSRTSDGLYFVLGNNGYWWSSTELSNIDAWGRLMGSSIGSIERYNHFKKGGGFSVRCLRDDE